MFELQKIIRPNVLRMKPYSSARDEYKGSEGVFLDANENPFNSPYNRYPDPLQLKVKQKLAILKGVKPEKIFLGNGSDEAIDLLIRAFCEPHVDNIVSIDPSYGMYQVAADTNAVEFRKVRLNEDFSLNVPGIKASIDTNTKLVFLCSPNNPTANSFSSSEILTIADNFNGLLVVDEAYIDFSPNASLVKELKNYPNLVILQTFSKAWGLAGLRIGLAFASEEIIAVLNKIKYPYNVNLVSQRLALEALEKAYEKDNWVNEILLQKSFLIELLRGSKLVEYIYPSDANFLLVKMKSCKALFDYLIENHIIIRDRSKVTLCEGCLRITVGTKYENRLLIDAIAEFEKLSNGQ